MAQYRDAIASLSERLGTDKWFLNSACVEFIFHLVIILKSIFVFSEPTPLDALAFAYLHCILHSSDAVRIEVTKRVNLVAWEWRVRGVIRGAFIQ